MMDGNRAIELIGQHRTQEVVITTMSSARAWPAVSRKPELDLPLSGCMGKASSIGLGIALARPDKRVLVLDGDGSLLMNLGSLVTIAAQAPRNLVHVVLEGDTYDTSGGQPTPGEGRADLASQLDVGDRSNAKGQHQTSVADHDPSSGGRVSPEGEYWLLWDGA